MKTQNVGTSPSTSFSRTARNPGWWSDTYDSAWDRVKAAFERDWDQTKHDFGGDEPDTKQNVKNTVAQAAGKQPIPPRGAPAPSSEGSERAHRFGFGARRHYGKEYPVWDENLEAKLEEDWQGIAPDEEWPRYRQAVRRGWQYEPKP